MRHVYLDLLAKNGPKIQYFSQISPTNDNREPPVGKVQRQKIVDNGLEVSYIVQKDEHCHFSIEMRQVYMDSMGRSTWIRWPKMTENSIFQSNQPHDDHREPQVGGFKDINLLIMDWWYPI